MEKDTLAQATVFETDPSKNDKGNQQEKSTRKT